MIFFVPAGSWLSLIQCRNFEGIYNTSICYKRSSGKTCFTTFLSNYNRDRAVVGTFRDASNLCKARVPGSNLVVINNAEDQRIVESFIGRHSLDNESIITDAQRAPDWSWVNGHRLIPEGSNSLHYLDRL